jgi:hypothetical protein
VSGGVSGETRIEQVVGQSPAWCFAGVERSGVEIRGNTLASAAISPNFPRISTDTRAGNNIEQNPPIEAFLKDGIPVDQMDVRWMSHEQEEKKQ